MRVVVIADDLTGANASAVRYARKGFSVLTVIDPDDLPSGIDAYDVCVYNTGTRDDDAASAARKVRAVASLAGDDVLMVKRIDTTLRGQISTEIEVCRNELPDDTRVLVVPAFPQAGRVTMGGVQLLDGGPVEVSEIGEGSDDPVAASRVALRVHTAGTAPVGEIPLAIVLRGSDAVRARLVDSQAPVVVCDALSDEHLASIADALVSHGQMTGQRWLVVDTGPFGAEVAARAFGPTAPRQRPVLVAAASSTNVTDQQLAAADWGLVRIDPRDPQVPSAVEAIVDAARSGPHRAIGFHTGTSTGTSLDGAARQTLRQAIGSVVVQVLEQVDVAGLYTTGGDATAAVCRALGAVGIEAASEVQPLAVAGRLIGGPHGGLPIVSKGGLVGDQGAAVACVEAVHELARGDVDRSPCTGAASQLAADQHPGTILQHQQIT